MVSSDGMRRREFAKGVACVTAGVFSSLSAKDEKNPEDALDVWQRETDLVKAATYKKYLCDGKTRGLASLEKLEAAFEKVMREVKETVVGDVPAVWSVYNMGYVVKTRNALFSIDLVHRRAEEFAPMLDFALITHNHADHWRPELYGAMNSAKKTVISNFLDNYGAADWRKGGNDWYLQGGFTRARKTFKIKDVEIKTSLVDHNDYLIDFTTAFEINVGGWKLYHTGDCGRGSESKLGVADGRPDLWLFFPGCGINVAEAVKKVKAKRIVFGHLWELGHSAGRLMTPKIRRELAAAAPECADVSVAFWGDRIS